MDRPPIFRYMELAWDLKLSVLAYLDTHALFAGLASCSKSFHDLVHSTDPAIISLFRSLLVTELGADLPLASHGIYDLDWRTALKSWMTHSFQWAPTTVEAHQGEEVLSARYLHRVAVAEGSTFIFGGKGNAEAGMFNDVWKVDADLHGTIKYKELLPVAPSPVPTPRFAASFNPVTVHGATRLCLFGGCTVQNLFLSDRMYLDPIARVWERNEEDEAMAEREGHGGDSMPQPRWGHTCNSFFNHVFLFGGSRPGEAFNDFWVLEPESRVWTEIKPKTRGSPIPHERGGHSAAVVQQRYLYVFGGNDLTDSFNDTWRIDLRECLVDGAADWERVETSGELPSERIGHGCLAIGNRLCIYGGRNYINGVYYDDFQVLDVVSRRWRQVDLGEAWGLIPRTGHAVVPHARGLLVFGGLSERTGALGDFGLIDVFSGALTGGTTTP